LHRALRVAGDADHAVRAWQDETLQPRRQPVVGKCPLTIERRDEPHIPMQRQHIGKTGKNGA